VQSLVLLLILIETKPALAAEYGSYREKLLEQEGAGSSPNRPGRGLGSRFTSGWFPTSGPNRLDRLRRRICSRY
jgi:hypothetical protein